MLCLVSVLVPLFFRRGGLSVHPRQPSEQRYIFIGTHIQNSFWTFVVYTLRIVGFGRVTATRGAHIIFNQFSTNIVCFIVALCVVGISIASTNFAALLLSIAGVTVFPLHVV